MDKCKKDIEKPLDCCKVMDCVSLTSVNNSVTIEKTNCGVDLRITGNNIVEALQINDGECITMFKEFIGGKLVITPVINWTCVASHICGLCASTSAPLCASPNNLNVS